MQPKYNLNNKSSNLIQMNIAQKRKSRHRVIGSIVLLFIALVVLLNVTSNVKPISINPQVVEIKVTSSAPVPNIKATTNSSATIAKSSSSDVISSDPIAVIANNNASQPKNAFRAGVVSKTTKSNTVATVAAPVQQKQPSAIAAVISTPENNMVKPKSPTIIATPSPKPSAKPKINPAAILDDIADVGHAEITKIEANRQKENNVNKSYIQFAALSSQEKATKLQQDLASSGVSATIQTIQTSKGTLYRLRAGPYSKEVAQSKLQQVSANGYSGIITGN